MQTEKFNRAIQEFDKANRADPNEVVWQGTSYPKELLYGQQMTACLNDFQPNASESLQLAARAQHICRWEIPRKSFPMNKEGYHLWRNSLKKFHAEKAAGILLEVGYDQPTIDQVKFLLQKKQLKRNSDTQTLEDVICLVFLQYYMEDFAAHNTEEKMIQILQKTWGKMSEVGQEKALTLKLPASIVPIIQKALS